MKGYDVVKKILSLLLSFILLAATGVSAAAAPEQSDDALNERLKAITLSVKETLDIGDDFTSFNGTLNESESASLWSLSWSGEKEQIYVSANENGRIVSFSDYITGSFTPSGGNIPRFPKMTLEEANAAAAAFLDKVLNTQTETVELKGNTSLDYSGNSIYYLNGTLKLNGIDTPIGISVSVSSATKKVMSFYRGDYGQDYSGVTKPAAATDMTAAAAALKGTLNMKLIYALPGDGSHTARLQYQPNPDGTYVVDAATGKLIDLSKLDWSNGRPGVPGKEAADSGTAAAPSSTLTPVEQAAVDKLQGVLSQSALESIIRAYTELGLTSDYQLQYINYYTYEDDNKETQVTVSLEMTYTPQDGESQYRYITMDAKTGKLISLSSNRIYTEAQAQETSYPYTNSQTEAVARAFASKILPDEMKQTVLSQDSIILSATDSTRYYAFLRSHDTIAFPENYITVGVDAKTGYVVSFYYNWYKFDVDFVSSAGIITADTASEKYVSAAGTTLKYINVPKSTDASGLLLAYTAADTSVWGVNAVTGDVLKAAAVAATGITYDDVSGNPYASIINKLAAYGVGFSGGSFKPDAQLTQLDALIFILSANGRTFTPMPLVTEKSSAVESADGKLVSPVLPTETDDIYNTAYSMGILTPAEKDPSRLVSRAEFVKYLVNALGYGDVAKLNGIFKAGFKDDKLISAELMGYVAIGKGLGIVRGDQNGRFKPNDITSRAIAAIMIYNCLSRS